MGNQINGEDKNMGRYGVCMAIVRDHFDKPSQPDCDEVNSTVSATPVTIIEPPRGWSKVNLYELWEYRGLLYFFAWRDIKVRYKQTLLGGMWAIIRPIATIIVFSLVFGRWAKVPSDGIPYPIFSYTGLLPWALFASALGMSANSLTSNVGLVRKVYFPRLILPTSTIFVGLVDFLLSFLVLLGLMLYYEVQLTVAVVWLPLLILLAMTTALGVGLWLAAFNAVYRDFGHVVPFLTQLWLFLTPVIYPSSLLSDSWRTWYGLNPMVGVVEGFRWVLLGSTPPGAMLGVSVVIALVVLISGIYCFKWMEGRFVDVV